MDSKDIRQKYIKFFVERGHKEIAPAKLVPENDPSTLFTSSGMQPLVPYLLGEEHPAGKRLVNSQPCFRAEDIEEVGDSRHTTFFEMLGNWSFGDYFKKEQLPWIWEFLTEELGLSKERLYVSVFDPSTSLGTIEVGNVSKDVESYEIWKNLGLAEDHIYFYGADKNWWSRSGSPDKMPVGEIGGPDSEIFYEFTQVEHDTKYGEKCHPNCNCGRFLEIGNSVFIQYQKQEDGSVKELSQKNVDFGGGLERLTAVVNNTPDIFQTDLYISIIAKLQELNSHNYKYNANTQLNKYFRIIADHSKAAVMIISDGISPSNKEQGYVVRRLLRKAIWYGRNYLFIDKPFTKEIVREILTIYKEVFSEKYNKLEDIEKIVNDEEIKFLKTIDKGTQELTQELPKLAEKFSKKKIIPPKDNIAGGILNELDKRASGEFLFYVYETYGLPPDLVREILESQGWRLSTNFIEEFQNAKTKHQELSRTASSGMFKGGLADHSEVVTKYHTATHLLHQALRDVLGPEVFQKGSNITAERLRFDFSFDRKMTDEEIKQVEDLINKKIEEDLKVDRKIVNPDEAKKMNAIGLFDEKYGSEVSIYGIEPGYSLDSKAKDQRDRGGYYSLEFCGGPHVEHTGVIGKIKITKEEAVSAGIRRIRAQVA